MANESSERFGDELPAGSMLCNGQYRIESYLNSGGFGITYLARDSLNRQIVIKECFPGVMCFRDGEAVGLRSRNSEEEFLAILDLFEKEARALSELQHPFIVGVHQIFKDNGTAYMALDFVKGHDLAQIIDEDPDRLGPEDVKALLLRILDAVDYIHGRDILHRDISPDNILIDEDNMPVLIDFGAARESATRVSRVLSKVLTVKDGYSPQEFYLQGSKQEYSSDLYALAASFYHLISGVPPVSSNQRMSAAARSADDPMDMLGTGIPGYDDYFLEAIDRCLSIFPADRLPSAAAWRDAIDLDRRRELLMEQAEHDEELARRVQRTVAEYRRMVADDLAAKKAREEAERLAKEGPKKPAKKRSARTASRVAGPGSGATKGAPGKAAPGNAAPTKANRAKPAAKAGAGMTRAERAAQTLQLDKPIAGDTAPRAPDPSANGAATPPNENAAQAPKASPPVQAAGLGDPVASPATGPKPETDTPRAGGSHSVWRFLTGGRGRLKNNGKSRQDASNERHTP